jgi:hypothetical protein
MPQIIINGFSDAYYDTSTSFNIDVLYNDNLISEGSISVYINNKEIKIVDLNGDHIKVQYKPASTQTLAIFVKFDETDNYLPSNATATLAVKKLPTKIAASNINAVYNVDKYIVATLKDNNGKPLAGVMVSINLNGVKTIKTNKNGQVKLLASNVVPKKYTVAITFAGNANYAKSTKSIKVTVKKATPKLTANAKKFKKSVKTKKYTVILKNNRNKAMAKVKLTIKVKGKTFTAKTNAKGKATFKITKLNKKGKFSAVVTYKGDKYYNKAVKKVKITVK